LTFAVMVVVQGVRGTAAACPMAPSSGVERSPEHDRSPDTAPQVQVEEIQDAEQRLGPSSRRARLSAAVSGRPMFALTIST